MIWGTSICKSVTHANAESVLPRCQRSEDRDQRTDVRDQRTDVRDQRTDVRDQRTDVRGSISSIGFDQKRSRIFKHVAQHRAYFLTFAAQPDMIFI
jgi:hypothetical protein